MSTCSMRINVSDGTVQLVHQAAALAHGTRVAVRAFAFECSKSGEHSFRDRIGTEKAHEPYQSMAALIAEQMLDLTAINLRLWLRHTEHVDEKHLSDGRCRETLLNDLRPFRRQPPVVWLVGLPPPALLERAGVDRAAAARAVDWPRDMGAAPPTAVFRSHRVDR